MESNPSDGEAWLLLGRVFFASQSFTEALASYSNAMEVNASDYRVWFHIGELYSACEQFHDAETAYKHAQSLPGANMAVLQQRLAAVGEAAAAAASAPNPAAPPAAQQAPPPHANTGGPFPATSQAPSHAPPPPPQTQQGHPQQQMGQPDMAPAPRDSAHTVVPPRLTESQYEHSHGRSVFSTLGGATTHNPSQRLPPSEVTVTTGAGSMGKFTCLAAPLSTLQEHCVPSSLTQTAPLKDLLVDTPRALSQVLAAEDGGRGSGPVPPEGPGEDVWLLPVSVLRLWFLLAVSDHSRHTAHTLYPDQHQAPPPLPPIHYNLLGDLAMEAAAAASGGAPVAQPVPVGSEGMGHYPAGPAAPQPSHGGHPAAPPPAPQAPAAGAKVEPVTAAEVRAMFGARFANRIRGRKGIRLMGVPPPSANPPPPGEAARLAEAARSLVACMGANAVPAPLWSWTLAELGLPRSMRGGPDAPPDLPLPQWAGALRQAQPTVPGVAVHVEEGGSGGRILLRLPSWPLKARASRRVARLQRLRVAGAADVGSDDEISSVDTADDEDEDRFVPVQPVGSAAGGAASSRSRPQSQTTAGATGGVKRPRAPSGTTHPSQGPPASNPAWAPGMQAGTQFGVPRQMAGGGAPPSSGVQGGYVPSAQDFLGHGQGGAAKASGPGAPPHPGQGDYRQMQAAPGHGGFPGGGYGHPGQGGAGGAPGQYAPQGGGFPPPGTSGFPTGGMHPHMAGPQGGYPGHPGMAYGPPPGTAGGGYQYPSQGMPGQYPQFSMAQQHPGAQLYANSAPPHGVQQSQQQAYGMHPSGAQMQQQQQQQQQQQPPPGYFDPAQHMQQGRGYPGQPGMPQHMQYGGHMQGYAGGPPPQGYPGQFDPAAMAYYQQQGQGPPGQQR